MKKGRVFGSFKNSWKWKEDRDVRANEQLFFFQCTWKVVWWKEERNRVNLKTEDNSSK